MFLLTVGKYIRLTLYTVRMHLISEMQNKYNFILQTIGMLFNDAALMVLWMIFFKKFPVVNGWQFSDTALLIGISWSGFFVFHFFASGIYELTTFVNTGQFDQYLLLPKSIIWQIAVSRSSFFELGSLIVSIYMLYISGHVTLVKIPFLLVLIMISAIITFNFALMLQTLSFYFSNLEYTLEKMTKTLFDLVFFPQSVFNNVILFIMMTIIPAFFIGTVPMQLIKQFQWSSFLLLLAFTAMQSTLAYLFFKKGLQRYESGNSINVKM